MHSLEDTGYDHAIQNGVTYLVTDLHMARFIDSLQPKPQESHTLDHRPHKTPPLSSTKPIKNTHSGSATLLTLSRLCLNICISANGSPGRPISRNFPSPSWLANFVRNSTCTTLHFGADAELLAS